MSRVFRNLNSYFVDQKSTIATVAIMTGEVAAPATSTEIK